MKTEELILVNTTTPILRGGISNAKLGGIVAFVFILVKIIDTYGLAEAKYIVLIFSILILLVTFDYLNSVARLIFNDDSVTVMKVAKTSIINLSALTSVTLLPVPSSKYLLMLLWRKGHVLPKCFNMLVLNPGRMTFEEFIESLKSKYENRSIIVKIF